MDYIGVTLYAVYVHILHIEAFTRGKVDLNGYQRILFAVNVFCLNIELRSVESGLVVGFDIVELQVVEYNFHHCFRVVPRRVVIDIFLRLRLPAFGETEGYVVPHTKCFEYIIRKVKTAFKFVFHLLFRTDYMTVGKSK